MCSTVNADANRLMFRFNPVQTNFPLFTAEVHGFGADTDPVQADADAAAAALEELYGALPPAQQAVLAQVLLQAASAIA
jgi:hypothetical protein